MWTSEHREAVWLSLKSLHIPFGTILISSLLLTGTLSAILSMVGMGPSSPIP